MPLRFFATFLLVAILALISLPVDAELTFHTLYSFTADSAASPRYPWGCLTEGRDGNFYGATQGGVATNAGTIFKMTPAGVVTVVHTFTGADGFDPVGSLTLGSDGNFYGMTASGGSLDNGTVFQLTPAGVLTTLVNFTDETGNRLGAQPCGALIQLSNGYFYGVTHSGGTAGVGTIFKVNAAGDFATLYQFSDAIGAQPYAGLTAGHDGSLYGTTGSGGPGFVGTIYLFDPTTALLTTVGFFDSENFEDGEIPRSALALGADGALYGNTYFGGASNQGTVFRVTTQNVLETLFAFDCYGVHKGSGPEGDPMVLGTDGSMYGMSEFGGDPDVNGGNIFKVTPDGAQTTLVIFDGNGSFPGAMPRSGLTMASDGNLYGATVAGGAADLGTLFVLSPTASATALTVSTDTADRDRPVTFTATVTPTPATPGPVVNFLEGATNLGSVVVGENGVATLTLTNLTAGRHLIVAQYAGIPLDVATSRSTPVSVLINSGDLPPTPGEFYVPAPEVAGDAASGTVTVYLQRTDSAGDVTISYRTVDGTAMAGRDYTATTGTLVLPRNQSGASVTILLLPTAQTGRQFTLEFLDPTGGATLRAPGLATVTIVNGALPYAAEIAYAYAQAAFYFAQGDQGNGYLCYASYCYYRYLQTGHIGDLNGYYQNLAYGYYISYQAAGQPAAALAWYEYFVGFIGAP